MRTLLNRLTILAALAVFLTVGACGASQRDRAISAAFVTTNASRDAFLFYDAAHQHEIATVTATSLDDGKTKLAEYRKKREPVVEAFALVYRLIATAAVLKDDPKAIPNLLQAASLLKAALDDLTGGKL